MLEVFYITYTIPVCLLLQNHDQIGLEMQSLQIKIVYTAMYIVVNMTVQISHKLSVAEFLSVYNIQCRVATKN